MKSKFIPLLLVLFGFSIIGYFAFDFIEARIANGDNPGVGNINTNSADVFDPVNNINTTDQRERVPAVIASGEKAPYETAFSRPDTTNFREYCLNDSTCFKYSVSYFACPSSLDDETAYLMEGVTQCEGLNDAPAFVIQKIPSDGQPAIIPPAYTTLFTSETYVQDQVKSDEIYDQKNGRTISCYDAKYDRVCRVTLADGTAYSLDGRWYNQTDTTAERKTMVQTTFDAIVRSMMGE